MHERVLKVVEAVRQPLDYTLTVDRNRFTDRETSMWMTFQRFKNTENIFTQFELCAFNEPLLTGIWLLGVTSNYTKEVFLAFI